ncbi:MAG: hypothetical protein NTU59_00175, partial [Coprothermobacterota bacterium]|nr:hypothetical protein [Coprothermobacterota bacterium]
MTELSLRLRIYLVATIGLGVAALVLVIPFFELSRLWDYLAFFLISYVAYVLTVNLPNLNASLSVASHVNLAALLLFGPFAIAIPGCAGTLPDRLPFRKLYTHLFNGAQLALSYGAAALVYYGLNGTPFLSQPPILIVTVGPVVAAGMAYFAVNLALNAGVIALDERTPFLRVFTQIARWEFPNLLITIPFALFIAYIYVGLGYWGLLILLLPFFASRFIFQTYIEIKNTYTETVKALMNTVDRKFGQPGRSQRIFEYATAVAHRLGLPDEEAEIIGYAAYLRHIGFLGLENRQLHRTVQRPSLRDRTVIQDGLLAGAKVVETMDFLRRAAPYIRLHHESWDGTDRILPEKPIPLGARIIAACEFMEEQEY